MANMEKFVSTAYQPVDDPRQQQTLTPDQQHSLLTYRPSQESQPVTQPGGWNHQQQGWSTPPYAQSHNTQQAAVPVGWSSPQHTGVTESQSVEKAPETVLERHVLPQEVVKHHRWRLFWYGVRYVIVAVVIGVILAIPIIVFRNDADVIDQVETIEEVRQKQYNNLIFYLFLWLEITWVSYFLSDWVALALPYAFRLCARYVNPSYQRYWRTFKVLRKPLVYVSVTSFSYIFFSFLINSNDLLAVNIDKDPNTFGWDDAIDDILEQLTLWVCFYLLEKIMIMYVSIHYHYRAGGEKIKHSKDMQNALMTLYEASVYLHPVNGGHFDEEDRIIRNAKGDLNAAERVRATTYLARMGIDGYKVASFFGNFFADDPNSHWMRPASSYATVERALSNPNSAAALAKRIWVSLAVSGAKTLKPEDIAEVLGPFRAEESKAIFKILDENESGDIQLEEMVGIISESGRVRRDIYRNMHDINHCINTFDWICLLILAGVMLFFILVAYVPSIKKIQETLGFVAIGLSFAVGRTFNHFLSGCVFVFFDHPFDHGDRVEIYNPGSTVGTAAVVKRQSVLYTVFRRLDNGTDLQMSNERLAIKRIENFTRSGINRQGLSLFVDFKTSFKDIMRLRAEMEEFLAEDDNCRDYMPGTLGISIVNLHELNKMELRIGITHKSNWSDEKLRAARSNKFHCALVACCRRIPLYKPGGASPALGEGGKPTYTVMLADDKAAKKVAEENQRREGLRWDAAKKAEEERAALPEVHEGMDEEEAAALRKQREEVALKEEKAAKQAAAAEEEEEAYASLRKTPAPGKPSYAAAFSSGVDLLQGITGLRMKPNSNTTGQEFSR